MVLLGVEENPKDVARPDPQRLKESLIKHIQAHYPQEEAVVDAKIEPAQLVTFAREKAKRHNDRLMLANQAKAATGVGWTNQRRLLTGN